MELAQNPHDHGRLDSIRRGVDLHEKGDGVTILNFALHAGVNHLGLLRPTREVRLNEVATGLMPEPHVIPDFGERPRHRTGTDRLSARLDDGATPGSKDILVEDEILVKRKRRNPDSANDRERYQVDKIGLDKIDDVVGGTASPGLPRAYPCDPFGLSA